MKLPKQTGLLLNENTGDIMLHHGRMALGNTLYQNQYILLNTRQGECKANPLRGIGIGDMLGDEGNELWWKKRIREQFLADGLKLKTLKVKNNGIEELEAYYE